MYRFYLKYLEEFKTQSKYQGGEVNIIWSSLKSYLVRVKHIKTGAIFQTDIKYLDCLEL